MKSPKTLPITIDDWNQYDVVILGDLPPEHFPVAAQESLSEYLKQRGGTLILIAGSQSMPQAYGTHPLEQILPVTRAGVGSVQPSTSLGYAFRVTEEGQGHDALMIGETEEATRLAWDFVNQFSPLSEVSEWRKPLATARTLIAADRRGTVDKSDTSAFLCWQPVGRGKIVYFSGAETYRLRTLRGDRFHYRLWGQLLRWAIASELSVGTESVRIQTDKSRYTLRDSIQVRVHLSADSQSNVPSQGLEARISSDDNQLTIPLSPGSIDPGRISRRGP